MLKNEQSRQFNPQMRAIFIANTAPPVPSIPLPPPLLSPSQYTTNHPTTSAISNQRIINARTNDITSIKGQFAWEKIPNSDVYMPIIFRDNTKFFCVRMLRKLLPDYPDDVINRSVQYQYPKRISTYNLTNHEVDLINRINSHHSRWSYSRQLFTTNDQLVRVSDYLSFYEYLRFGGRRVMSTHSNPTTTTTTTTTNTVRQSPSQNHQPIQRTNEYLSNMPTILRGQSAVPQSALSVMMNSYSSSADFSRESAPSLAARPILPSTPNLPHPSCPQQQRRTSNPLVPMIPQQAKQVIQSTPSSTNIASNISSTVHSNPLLPPPPPTVSQPKLTNSSSVSLITPSPCSSSSSSSSSSVSPIIPPVVPCSTTMQKKSSTKPSRPICGWLQVNKLYTPYITTSATNHHLYKLPISLLSFYNLLKTSSNDSCDSKETIFPFEQTLGTSEEIDLINNLCVQQNIQPFSADTKLVDLATFYQYCSSNIIFVKELSSVDPKGTICKDWLSVVKISGGICRLRHITTLNEQTVPIIGNNVVKSFVLSPQTLSSAKITEPTLNELEFIQMILFFSNMSMNLRHAQLIDLESVQKEYNVDVILLYNDKFPLNVLNYQQQGHRTNPTQTSILPSTTTSTKNTIAESTPPPSPPSPQSQPQPAATNLAAPPLPPPPPPPASSSSLPPLVQLPLQSSNNRYNKVVDFHGHSLTAYVCSGLDISSQRDCVSIKSLCEILFPNSPHMDKIEMKMLKLLRLKNINRFRPQNQKSVGFTRLIDIKDAEKHWQDIEREMRTMFNNNPEETVRISTSTKNSTASNMIVESVENVVRSDDKGDKRSLDDEQLDEEDTPVLERLNKRMRVVEKENNDVTTTNDEQQDKTKKPTIKLFFKNKIKKRVAPSNRTNRNTAATWVKKYQLEDCFVQLTKYDPVYDDGTI